MGDFYDRIAFRRTWPSLLAAAVVFIAAIQIFRVNVGNNDPKQVSSNSTPVPWTRGPVFTGMQTVPAGRFLAARIELNHRDTLSGRFRVLATDGRVNCVLLPAAELEKWRNGLEYTRIAETGYLPQGRINRELEAGSYFLILDNQSSPKEQQVEADFSVE